MIVQCVSCKARLRVSEENIPADGLKMRCPTCKTIFRVRRPGTAPSASKPPAAAAVQPPAPAEVKQPAPEAPAEQPQMLSQADAASRARSGTMIFGASAPMAESSPDAAGGATAKPDAPASPETEAPKPMGTALYGVLGDDESLSKSGTSHFGVPAPSKPAEPSDTHSAPPAAPENKTEDAAPESPAEDQEGETAAASSPEPSESASAEKQETAADRTQEAPAQSAAEAAAPVPASETLPSDGTDTDSAASGASDVPNHQTEADKDPAAAAASEAPAKPADAPAEDEPPSAEFEEIDDSLIEGAAPADPDADIRADASFMSEFEAAEGKPEPAAGAVSEPEKVQSEAEESGEKDSSGGESAREEAAEIPAPAPEKPDVQPQPAAVAAPQEGSSSAGKIILWLLVVALLIFIGLCAFCSPVRDAVREVYDAALAGSLGQGTPVP